ncbi:hypothetical protein BE221DRAFT_76237 [Ostreococcus tauri]|uniref:RWP-RK domain-containing protein n=1 Tax=Ostreococcus tauri TaxID=70448 RepID=A0A1Y5ICM5_OSTTA|nr:hypothetical protein BE221DRAFT_76237 [Ostreococcus tauri]
MGLDCVYAHALLSADDAAIELGFGTTTFKKRLRQLGVRRWPGRQFAGVLKCYEYIVTVLNVRKATRGSCVFSKATTEPRSNDRLTDA